MTQREAKKWACGEAAALLRSDAETGEIIRDDDPDREKKRKAFNELLSELRRRAGGY